MLVNSWNLPTIDLIDGISKQDFQLFFIDASTVTFIREYQHSMKQNAVVSISLESPLINRAEKEMEPACKCVYEWSTWAVDRITQLYSEIWTRKHFDGITNYLNKSLKPAVTDLALRWSCREPMPQASSGCWGDRCTTGTSCGSLDPLQPS